MGPQRARGGRHRARPIRSALRGSLTRGGRILRQASAASVVQPAPPPPRPIGGGGRSRRLIHRPRPGAAVVAIITVMVLIVSALAIERVAGVTLLPSGLTAGLRPPPKKFPVLPASPPVSIAAKRIDLNAQIHPVGLAADGSIGVPGEDQAHEAAWYEQSPTPGQYGPSVIVGHVDNRSGPAVFHGLKELRAGDEVDVSRADGSTAVFAVDAVKRYDKERIPPDEVYGDFSRPNLRLITCGGRWVGGQTGYSDNVVVFATLVRSR
ncbi:class F sortase [Melissospora conviva]|uniref:class F sortase n=1 Tax=Melissospora conviva TaxID=3388432 RepID=UPI003B7B5312